MLSMDFKKIEVYKFMYRLISCLDFKKVSMNGASWIVQIVSIDVVFELQRIVQIVSIDVVLFGFQIGFNELCELYLLMLCLDLDFN